MEKNHIDNDGEPSQTETNISLEGKKIEVPSPAASETGSQEHCNDTKLEKKKFTREEMVKNKPKYCQSLALQMFSHLKTQRQLEEQKQSKIARSDRRRQKIKRELAGSCPPVGSSLKSFGSSWTQFRMLRGQQSKLQKAHTDAQSDVSQAFSNKKEHTNLTHTDALEIKGYSGHKAVSIHFADNASRDQPNGRIQNTAVSPEHFQQLQQGRQTGETSSHRLERSEHYISSKAGSTKSPNIQCRETPFSDYNSSKSHVLKGPGKIQIRLSTASTPSSRQANRGQKHNYQWDTMPAGMLTSVQPSLITFDGSIL